MAHLWSLNGAPVVLKWLIVKNIGIIVIKVGIYYLFYKSCLGLGIYNVILYLKSPQLPAMLLILLKNYLQIICEEFTCFSGPNVPVKFLPIIFHIFNLDTES